MQPILLVDNEANLRLVHRLMPGGNGYEIVEAGSSDKALQVLSNAEMDAVVPDCRLPDIGGLQLMNAQPKYNQLYDDFYDWEAEAFGLKPADLLELQGAWAWSFQPQNRGAAGERCSRL